MNRLIEFEGSKVRILNEDGSVWDGHSEPWFIPTDIAEAIGYSDPRVAVSKVISRNPERFMGLQGVTKLVTPGGVQDITVVNESGLYMFLMVSRTDKAISFQRKVTQVLADVRKGKLTISDSTALEAIKQLVGVVESHNKRIDTVENRVSSLEFSVKNEILITNRQAATIRFTSASRIRELLGDDYKERSKKYFIWMYKEIYARFAVPSYRDIPKSEFDAVLNLISEWTPVQSVKKTG